MKSKILLLGAMLAVAIPSYGLTSVQGAGNPALESPEDLLAFIAHSASRTEEVLTKSEYVVEYIYVRYEGGRVAVERLASLPNVPIERIKRNEKRIEYVYHVFLKASPQGFNGRYVFTENKEGEPLKITKNSRVISDGLNCLVMDYESQVGDVQEAFRETEPTLTVKRKGGCSVFDEVELIALVRQHWQWHRGMTPPNGDWISHMAVAFPEPTLKEQNLNRLVFDSIRSGRKTTVEAEVKDDDLVLRLWAGLSETMTTSDKVSRFGFDGIPKVLSYDLFFEKDGVRRPVPVSGAKLELINFKIVPKGTHAFTIP